MMRYSALLLMFCLMILVLTGCGDAVEQVLEQVGEEAETFLNDSEELEPEAVDAAVEPEDIESEPEVVESDPDLEPADMEKIALSLEQKAMALETIEDPLCDVIRERFIEPGDVFIPAVAWVMDEVGIWPGDDFIPVVALILMEIEEALDDEFVYEDGRIYLRQDKPGKKDIANLLPTIEKLIKEVSADFGGEITTADLEKIIQKGGILQINNITREDLLSIIQGMLAEEKPREQVVAQAIHPFRDRFIGPGDRADGKPTPETIDAFIPVVTWVMDEAGIWPGDNFIPVVALILMEIEEVFDDQFVYIDEHDEVTIYSQSNVLLDERIYLKKNQLAPNENFLPMIEKMVKKVSAEYGDKITPADYEKIIQKGGILQINNITKEALLGIVDYIIIV